MVPKTHQRIGTVQGCEFERQAPIASHEQSLTAPDSQDLRFETVVNMFVEPAAFLLMAGRGAEDIAAFDHLPAVDKDRYLKAVFAEHVAPALPDRVLNKEQVLFGGETYTLKRKAGAGAYGAVSLYVSHQGRSLAIKSQKRPDFREAIQELRNHFHAQGRTLTSAVRGITRLLGVIWAEGELLMVQEYLPGGSYLALNHKLELAIKKGILSNAQLLSAIHATAWRDAAKGLAETNANGVLHDDMHDENLIFEGGKGRVCDFGTSRIGSARFHKDAIALGDLAREKHPGLDRERPAVFAKGAMAHTTPSALLKEARPFFKDNGVGGPHVRAVMSALTEWDGEDDERVIATRDAYVETATAVKRGHVSWRDLKAADPGDRS